MPSSFTVQSRQKGNKEKQQNLGVQKPDQPAELARRLFGRDGDQKWLCVYVIRRIGNEVDAGDWNRREWIGPSRLEQPNPLSRFPAPFVPSGPGDNNVRKIFLWLAQPVHQVLSHHDRDGCLATIGVMNQIGPNANSNRSALGGDGRMKEVKPHTNLVHADSTYFSRILRTIMRTASHLHQSADIKENSSELLEAGPQLTQIVSCDSFVPLFRQCSVVIGRQVNHPGPGVAGARGDFAGEKCSAGRHNRILADFDSAEPGFRLDWCWGVRRLVPVEIQRDQLMPDLTQVPKLNDPIAL